MGIFKRKKKAEAPVETEEPKPNLEFKFELTPCSDSGEKITYYPSQEYANDFVFQLFSVLGHIQFLKVKTSRLIELLKNEDIPDYSRISNDRSELYYHLNGLPFEVGENGYLEENVICENDIISRSDDYEHEVSYWVGSAVASFLIVSTIN